MNKLIFIAAIASLVGGASLAWANPEHHVGAEAMPMAGTPMKGGKHHAMHGHGHKMHCKHGAGAMHGMSGDHGMMDKGGMDHQHMQQMHDHMSESGMMGGGMMGAGKMDGSKMGDMAPTATPTPVAPK